MPYDTDRDIEVVPVERRRRWTAWIGGFIVAIVAVIVAVLIYFAVSDDDDDGNIEVPAVDVTVDEGSEAP